MNFNVLFLYICNCRHYLSKSFSYFRYKISYYPDNFGGKTTYLILVSGLRQLVYHNHILNLRMWFLIFTSFFIAIFIAAFFVYALEFFLRW